MGYMGDLCEDMAFKEMDEVEEDEDEIDKMENNKKYQIKIKYAGIQNASREEIFPFISIIKEDNYIIINNEFNFLIKDIIKIEF